MQMKNDVIKQSCVYAEASKQCREATCTSKDGEAEKHIDLTYCGALANNCCCVWKEGKSNRVPAVGLNLQDTLKFCKRVNPKNARCRACLQEAGRRYSKKVSLSACAYIVVHLSCRYCVSSRSHCSELRNIYYILRSTMKDLERRRC
jgi:hypothetical protein